jgi:hypothetical protein
MTRILLVAFFLLVSAPAVLAQNENNGVATQPRLELCSGRVIPGHDIILMLTLGELSSDGLRVQWPEIWRPEGVSRVSARLLADRQRMLITINTEPSLPSGQQQIDLLVVNQTQYEVVSLPVEVELQLPIEFYLVANQLASGVVHAYSGVDTNGGTVALLRFRVTGSLDEAVDLYVAGLQGYGYKVENLSGRSKRDRVYRVSNTTMTGYVRFKKEALRGEKYVTVSFPLMN